MRRGRGGLEVGGVVVAVQAAVVLSERGGGVAGRVRRRGALEAVGGRAVADEINELRSGRADAAQCDCGIDEGDLTRGRAQSDVARRVRGG